MTTDTKYRLKFLFQQIDLQLGDFTIGRSPACNLTLEDPLVSREHARIHLTGDTAEIEDLDSRNGVLVNSERLQGRRPLANSDRIRIGGHEMIFIIETNARRSFRTTGAMRHCPSCRTPVAVNVTRCPHCSALIKTDTTVPIHFDRPSAVTRWTADMLIDVVEKAIKKGNFDQAERSLETRVTEYESNQRDADTLGRMSGPMLAIARHRKSTRWLEWMVEAWAESAEVMPMELFGTIADLSKDGHLPTAIDLARRYVNRLRDRNMASQASALETLLNSGDR